MRWRCATIAMRWPRLHLMDPRMCWAQPADGEIFYSLGGNVVINSRLTAMDVGPL